MLKRLRVAQIPELVPASLQGTIAVVIDTLRFTTTACQALFAGALHVKVAADIDAVRTLAAECSPKPLLCGERLCRPIAGFDLGNSPYEYTSESVAAKNLIFSTTNGTRAVSSANDATGILLGSLVNRTAIAQAIISADESEVCIICSGTDGEVAGEDVLAAGAIIEAVQAIHNELELINDSAVLASYQWQDIAQLPVDKRPQAIVNAFQRFRGGSNLIAEGYSKDLGFSARVDHIPIIPRSINGANDTFVGGLP